VNGGNVIKQLELDIDFEVERNANLKELQLADASLKLYFEAEKSKDTKFFIGDKISNDEDEDDDNDDYESKINKKDVVIEDNNVVDEDDNNDNDGEDRKDKNKDATSNNGFYYEASGERTIEPRDSGSFSIEHSPSDLDSLLLPEFQSVTSNIAVNEESRPLPREISPPSFTAEKCHHCRKTAKRTSPGPHHLLLNSFSAYPHPRIGVYILLILFLLVYLIYSHLANWGQVLIKDTTLALIGSSSKIASRKMWELDFGKAFFMLSSHEILMHLIVIEFYTNLYAIILLIVLTKNKYYNVTPSNDIVRKAVKILNKYFIQLLRCRLALQRYDLDINYIRGQDNIISDCLSRVI